MMNNDVDREEGNLERRDDANANANANHRPNLHQLLGIDGVGRMDLTEHERNLAINIKEAIAATPDVDTVSDFMCAQLALIDGDDTEAAIERVHHLQGLREEYRILDTAQDGSKCFRDYVALFPELLLDFTYVSDAGQPDVGHYVLVYDAKKFRCSELNSEERLRTVLGAAYYMCVCLSPDFEAIKSGCIVVAECEGYDWKRNLDFKSLKKLWSEVATVYPVLYKKMKLFNASNSMVIVQNMLKPLFPNSLRKKIDFGCKNEQRLDTLYMVPTVEAANMRVLTFLGENLKKRYENERTFRL